MMLHLARLSVAALILLAAAPARALRLSLRMETEETATASASGGGLRSSNVGNVRALGGGAVPARGASAGTSSFTHGILQSAADESVWLWPEESSREIPVL